MRSFKVFVRQDRNEAPNTWWMKGEYKALDAREAVETAFEGTYLTPSRSGSRVYVDRVAAVGPGVPWEEFEVTRLAMPVDIKKIVSVPSERDED